MTPETRAALVDVVTLVRDAAQHHDRAIYYRALGILAGLAGAAVVADPRERLIAGLGARLELASPDELAVVDYVLAGLERGRDVYGPLDIDRDRRDFDVEAAEELRDWLIYREIAAIQRNRARST